MDTVQIKKQKRVMDKEGLCSTCIHQDDCIYCNMTDVVHQCEEFETYSQERKINKISIPEKNVSDEQFAGLCENCANRENCIFAKPDGGVWHCEEYR